MDNSKKEINNVQYNQAMEFLGHLIEYVDNIDAILRDVANHYDADRAYVFELSKDGKTIDNTYEWCKSGIEPQIDNLKNVPYESVAVWFEEYKRVGAFFISSLDKDVESNSITYEILEPQGIESLITAPIYNNDKMIGFIGVDNPQRNTNDLVILKATASILNSEISRKIATKNQKIEEMTKTQIKQNAELVEIRDIIASANMGTWRIELVENEEPRMFADDTMKNLLGIKKKNESPEEVYNDWFSNITPAAMSSVLNSVSKMEQGYFDENTYLWNHPTKGVRYVRCGGTAKTINGGYSLQGYHYDVDEVVRKNQAQMLKLKKALDDKKEYFDTLGALGGVFYSLHVVDLANDTVAEFNAINEVKELTNDKMGPREMMIHVMSNVTNSEYKDSALEYTDLSTLADRMRGKKYISKEFLGNNVGWFLASFITMDADEDGRPTKVIYATRVIDEEKKQEQKLIHKSQTDELTGLLNRRAYEETIYEHNDIPVEDKFIYVSIDVNGLKVTNDTLGHAAGDELLVGISSCMKQSLGKYGNLYRIGGDEFVATLFCTSKEVKTILADFDKIVQEWKGKLIKGLSASYGWIDKYEMPNASTRQLAAIADRRMYDQKADYYHKKGIDRRGQQEAHKVLCNLYTKILKINITDDTYNIINMDENEKALEKGFADKISEWLISFGKTEQVHPDDLNDYLENTDIKHISDYFKGGKTSLSIFYRRKYGDDYKQVMMEIVPADDYDDNNQNLFLYVKKIDK